MKKSWAHDDVCMEVTPAITIAISYLSGVEQIIKQPAAAFAIAIYHSSLQYLYSNSKPTMKLFSTIIVSSCLATQAFGVTPVVSKGLAKPALVTQKSPLRQKHAADVSPLFRDPLITRGGAVPGLQAYGDALEKNPITTKALTSLVGWLLGDLLAQVS